MAKINVVYWSQTGNTQKMAEAVGEGIKNAGKEPEVVEVSAASIDDLKASDAFALGCPAMGAETLEEMEMEPFVEELTQYVSGKKIALFGSYGWGDGQWMRDFEDRITSYGGQLISDGLIVQNEPEDNCEECLAFGMAIAKA